MLLAERECGVFSFERRPKHGFRSIWMHWLQRGGRLRMGHRMRNGSGLRREEEHH
jgi:hypothetical protein